MEKRYQVFVSSTFADLKEERRSIMQTLMEMDCIPAGMELFPAADEEQWDFIRRVIDDCDYYLLVIGGRYGSVTPEGISYTEKEFDYAVSKDMKVVALLHGKPDEIPVGKSELDPVLRERLETFRQKVSTGRLVRFWSRTEELSGLVALSLAKTIKTYPAIGWVRANTVANEDLLTQLNQLRQDNDALRTALAEARPPVPRLEGLAGLDEPFVINFESGNHDRHSWSVSVSWGMIFGFVAPYILRDPSEESLRQRLVDWIAKQADEISRNGPHRMDDHDFITISIQLRELGLVRIFPDNSIQDYYWELTPQGEQTMVQLRAIRSSRYDEAGTEELVE